MQYDENAEKYGYEGEMTPLKCNELKAYGMDDPAIGEEYEMYKVAEVDELLVKKDKEIARQNIEIKEAVKTMKFLEAKIIELKEKLESVQASTYAESVDAGMREHRLKRALYKACANWAHAEYRWASLIDFKCPETWDEMERKCRAKMEEYK